MDALLRAVIKHTAKEKLRLVFGGDLARGLTLIGVCHRG